MNIHYYWNPTFAATLMLVCLAALTLAGTAERSEDGSALAVSIGRADAAPTAREIKSMLEAKFTSIYEDHFGGKEKSSVAFDWLAPVQVGGQRTLGSLPGPCWVANIDVKVTFTRPSTGETKSVRRGINGNPVKEGFCIYRDAYDAWTYSTYAP